MRQLFRFFLRPAAFVNQLQWSQNHLFILLAFLGIALVEAQVGVGHSLNLQLSWLVAGWAGIAQDQALFIVLVGRIAFLFFGALSVAETLWWLGGKLGRQTSKRVLQRRLTVVLCLLLASYTLFSLADPLYHWVGTFASAWALLLSYLTLREQFAFDRLSGAIVGALTVLTILLSWQVSDQVVKTAAAYLINDQVATHRAHHR